MDESVVAWLELLDVQEQGDGMFVGAPAPQGLPRVFGGQFLGQALSAAMLTVPRDWLCHSLHAYFLRPGKPGRPIEYEVLALRDGQRMAARRVTAVQRGEITFELTASFERDAPGPEHQEPLTSVPPGPETFPAEEERIAKLLEVLPPERHAFVQRRSPVEYIWIDPRATTVLPPSTAPIRSWMRVRDRLPDDPGLHRAGLAYASDMGALEPALRAVGTSHSDPEQLIASLDHALWIHRPFRIDEWLLFTFLPTSVSAGRGLSRGLVHTREGVHVATLTQEAIMRPRALWAE
jgi:acyl-CoA thioesterase-2